MQDFAHVNHQDEIAKELKHFKEEMKKENDRKKEETDRKLAAIKELQRALEQKLQEQSKQMTDLQKVI